MARGGAPRSPARGAGNVPLAALRRIPTPRPPRRITSARPVIVGPGTERPCCATAGRPSPSRTHPPSSGCNRSAARRH
eukprot:2663516-Alexandrium_andersonii.AAC.1